MANEPINSLDVPVQRGGRMSKTHKHGFYWHGAANHEVSRLVSELGSTPIWDPTEME